MIMYVCGCSHTNGADGLYQEKDKVWPSLIMSSYVNEYTFIEEINKSLPKTNLLINNAMAGAGNDYIFHTSLESIEKLISINKKPDLVIIQWSSPNRRQHQLIDGKNIWVSIQRNVNYHVKFEPMGSKHTVHYMYSLQEYLKSNDIKYLFFNFMELDESIDNLEILKKIDLNNFVHFGSNNILKEGIMNQILINSFHMDNEYHANKHGNYFIAENISNKLGLKLIDKDVFYYNDKMI
jgi:hypothetical protein